MRMLNPIGGHGVFPKIRMTLELAALQRGMGASKRHRTPQKYEKQVNLV